MKQTIIVFLNAEILDIEYIIYLNYINTEIQNVYFPVFKFDLQIINSKHYTIMRC